MRTIKEIFYFKKSLINLKFEICYFNFLIICFHILVFIYIIGM